jgi:hypothetical protein
MIGKLNWGVYFACVAFGVVGYVVGLCSGSLVAQERGYLKICRDWVREHAWDMDQLEYMQAIKKCEGITDSNLSDAG